jgi:hypothetical protein
MLASCNRYAVIATVCFTACTSKNNPQRSITQPTFPRGSNDLGSGSGVGSVGAGSDAGSAVVDAVADMASGTTVTIMPPPHADLGTVVVARNDMSAGNSPPALRHHRCGWLGADNPDGGAASFAANIDFFDAIHPVWFSANADGSIRANSYADDTRVVSVARAHNVLLMPLIYGGDDPAIVRGIMSSPAKITAHVNALVSLVVSRGYDGIDEDYEHLWTAADRPGFVALNQQLAVALHAKGKQLSLAVSPQTVDNGQSAYADVAIVQNGADILHLMGYDFHSTDTDHLGPQAPLGWLDAVGARMQSAGVASHTIMGFANYGIGTGWYTLGAAAAISRCGGTYVSTTTHMLTCPYGIFTAGTSPHCTTSQGELWFEDATSITEKSRNAASHGLRGVTIYDLGGEPPGYYDALRAGYPL